MNETTERWIDESLHALAADDARVIVPLRVATVVMQAWDTQQKADAHKRERRWRKALGWALVPAAAALLVLMLLQRDAAVSRGDVTPPAAAREPAWAEAAEPAATNASHADADVAQGRALPSRRPINSTAVETGYVLIPDPFVDPTALHVVRVRMARVGLASLGLPIVNPDAEGLVDVEMLVGEDGVARSIRRAALVTGEVEAGGGR